MATRVTDDAREESVSRVSRLRRSRARALLSLNLKKKRDCSQSTVRENEPLLIPSSGRIKDLTRETAEIEPNEYVIVIISKKLRTKTLTYTSYKLKMLKCQID